VLIEPIIDRLQASSTTHLAQASVSTLHQLSQTIRHGRGGSTREIFLLSHRESNAVVALAYLGPTSILTHLAASPEFISKGKRDVDMRLLGHMLHIAPTFQRDGLKAYAINFVTLKRYLDYGAVPLGGGQEDAREVQWTADAVKEFESKHEDLLDSVSTDQTTPAE
jgi:hypothetical protein